MQIQLHSWGRTALRNPSCPQRKRKEKRGLSKSWKLGRETWAKACRFWVVGAVVSPWAVLGLCGAGRTGLSSPG